VAGYVIVIRQGKLCFFLRQLSGFGLISGLGLSENVANSANGGYDSTQHAKQSLKSIKRPPNSHSAGNAHVATECIRTGVGWMRLI
jgi:hypothetical protein